MSSIDVLRGIASIICSKYSTLCFSESDSDDLVIFAFTWVENFYYINPVECAKDLKCIETIFEMHSTVLKLARDGRYIVNNDIELIEKSIKRLLELSSILSQTTTQ